MEDLIRQIETIDASKVDAFVLTLNEKPSEMWKALIESWWRSRFYGTPVAEKPIIILEPGESLTAIESRTVNETRVSEGLPPIRDEAAKHRIGIVDDPPRVLSGDDFHRWLESQTQQKPAPPADWREFGEFTGNSIMRSFFENVLPRSIEAARERRAELDIAATENGPEVVFNRKMLDSFRTSDQHPDMQVLDSLGAKHLEHLDAQMTDECTCESLLGLRDCPACLRKAAAQ